MRLEPTLVTKLTKICMGWVVGSAADPEADLDKVKDFDIIIPFEHWREAAVLIPIEARPNTFGGWKFKTSEGPIIDVWPGDLMWLLQNCQNKYIWHPFTGVRYRKI